MSFQRHIGVVVQPPKWIPTPKGMNSLDFTTLLFEKASVVVAAGAAYGEYGEGYIRISLTVPDDRLNEALERIRHWVVYESKPLNEVNIMMRET